MGWMLVKLVEFFFQYGVNDDHLRIIHEANSDVVINARTPQGLSKEYNLTN